jgi:hypothetical protein
MQLREVRRAVFHDYIPTSVRKERMYSSWDDMESLLHLISSSLSVLIMVITFPSSTMKDVGTRREREVDWDELRWEGASSCTQAW